MAFGLCCRLNRYSLDTIEFCTNLVSMLLCTLNVCRLGCNYSLLVRELGPNRDCYCCSGLRFREFGLKRVGELCCTYAECFNISNLLPKTAKCRPC